MIRTLDESAERQQVEHLHEQFPRTFVTVLTDDFVVEAIGLGDLATLVVAPYQCDALGVHGLEHQEVADGLDTMVPPIYEVSVEDIGGLRRVASRTE